MFEKAKEKFGEMKTKVKAEIEKKKLERNIYNTRYKYVYEQEKRRAMHQMAETEARKKARMDIQKSIERKQKLGSMFSSGLSSNKKNVPSLTFGSSKPNDMYSFGMKKKKQVKFF